MDYNKQVWGFELTWADQKEYSGRVLIIKQGESTPFAFHKTRDKTVFVLQGIVNLVMENQTKMLGEGSRYHIPAKIMHQLVALQGDATILEAGTQLVDDLVEVKK